MENRAKLKFVEVKKMVDSLNGSISLVSENTNSKFDRALKDSVIQRFEYSIEGIWKFLKYFLYEEYGENLDFPKEVFKSAYKMWTIVNLGIFIDMIDRRNRLSHDYHDDFSEKSFDIIVDEYIDEINTFIKNISEKYEN